MTVELWILLLTLVLALATFFIGKWTAAKSLGERWGRIETTIENIEKSIDRIETTSRDDLKEQREEYKREIKELQAAMKAADKDTDESIKRIHDRIDGHIRDFHGGTT